MFISNLIVAFVCFLQFSTFAHNLPSNWKRCKLDDLECLRSAVEDAVHDLSNGNKDLDMPQLEPLQIDSLDIAKNEKVTIEQHYKNLKIHGLGASKVKSVSLEGHTVKAESFSPEIRIEADYNMDGQYGQVIVKGSGPCNVTLFDTEISHVLNGHFIEQNGKQFYEVKEYHLDIKPKNVKFNFEKLENGDSINSNLNQQWDVFFNAVKSDYEKAFSGIFTNLANKVFKQVPIVDILL